MTKIGLILALTITALPAIAQTEGQRQDNAQMAYYQAHQDQRKLVLQRCDALDDKGKTDSDCILARKADNQAGVDDVKNGVGNVVQGAADFFHNIGN